MELIQQPVQVLAVAVFLAQGCCDGFKLTIIDPAIAPGDLFRAGDAQALALLDGLVEMYSCDG